MTDFNEIQAAKPTNILQREINLNLKSFLLTVGKGAVNIAFLQWDDLAENGVELLESLGLEAKPEEIAGLLIIRALTTTIKKLIKGNKDLFIQEPGNPKELFQFLSDGLTNHPIVISENFFSYPKELPLIDNIKIGFLQWLKPLIENKKEAESISNRLPEYFVYALTEEWQNNKEDYLILIEQLDTPFTQANKREQGWFKYRAWLQQQIQEPVFWEAFSLKQIYIPLRAYYEENNHSSSSLSRKRQSDELVSEEKEKKRIVSKLSNLLESWVNEANKDDAICLLTGGPGSGKSSFTKMFAASLAEKNELSVLYIPLHRFNLSDDLIKAVGEFVQFDGFLSENPLDANNSDLRLLIIFDGLDELSKQGKIAEEVAREFVEEVRDKVREFNIHKTRLQVLISGREVVIQAHRSKFRQDKQLLYLCPYFVSEEALLVVLNACARVTENLSNIKWPTPESFGEWIGRLLGQRKDTDDVFVMQCLSFLNLQNCNLLLRDFYGANLVGAYLVGAYLVGANLEGANLEWAENITPEQIKEARNWELANYNPDFREALGLPAEDIE